MSKLVNGSFCKISFSKIVSYLITFSCLILAEKTLAQELPNAQFIQSEITRLNSEEPKNELLLTQYQTLLNQIDGFDAQRSLIKDYRSIVSQYPLQKERLLKQIEQAEQLDLLQTKQLDSYSDLSQSIASLQAAINEWSNTSKANAEISIQLTTDRKTLPVSLAQLSQQLEQASIIKNDNGSDIEQWLQLSNLTYLKLQQEATAAELQSLDERTELLRLEQKLLDRKIQLASPLLITLQDKLTRVEQASVKNLIADVRSLETDIEPSDLIAVQNFATVTQYADELEQILATIEQSRIEKQQLEVERRSLAEEQRLIKDNLSWLKNSTAFGASIRAQLQRLPNQVGDKSIPDDIAAAHIRKYEISQTLADHALNSAVQSTHNKGQLVASTQTQTQTQTQTRINTLSLELLKQLTTDYEKLIIALGKLQLTINQYSLEVDSARSFLREQQFWTRSNVPFWQHMTDFSKITWFGDATPLQSMIERSDIERLKLIGIAFIIYSVVLIYGHGRLKKRATQLRHDYQKAFGHPLRDRFQNTMSLLSIAAIQALVLPFGLVLMASSLFWVWPIPNATESKMLILASAGALFFLELIYALSPPKGLLNLHLNWPDHVCFYLHKESRKLRFPLTIFLLCIFFADLVAGEQEAEISRMFFLVLTLAMALIYAALLKPERIPAALPSPVNKGLGLLSLKVLLFGSFFAIVVMAILGLFIASWLLLLYQQLTLFVILGVLFIYQLGERWLKLEHRQLNYQRLLARREELIAQQQEQAEEPPELAELRENFPEVEEKSLGSEQISEQSMTLLRGLSLIALIAAVLTLWSSALEMTRWLDNVVIWQVSEAVSGSSTLVDVTLQSLIYALTILLVTFVGVRNLPGILELLVLRRLELSPGTGYAITTLLRYLILMTGVLSAFAILGFQWSRLQWLVAAFGVGLGFGLQEIFANFISGLILLFERPIRIGDIVTINELSGTVSKIQTRATTIIDWDNKEIVVPNKTFITEKLINWSLTDSITRIVIPIGVAYGSDVSKVEALLYRVAEEHPLVLNDPSPSVFFLAFGASSLDFELRVHINSIDHRLSTIHLINKNIDKLFKENDIEIAFPQMDVHVRDWPQQNNATE
ncbi:mechanosensitive ion channel [Vibrio alfacsensis]|uniref:mechanosensitive ion channel domain-containing protein n=1 Tax=Vibrio alfacsensis TaxID=1074311 RepID=UPI002ADD8FCC|nr:mechanosensitive ion channel domain-containing protein [Vibrio alfacsensis]WQE77805.1 mechanosensitive ion channel [Vibrio alfacsensis]